MTADVARPLPLVDGPHVADRQGRVSRRGSTVTGSTSTNTRLSRLLWPLVTCVLTVLYSAVPVLIGSRDFYRRGDSAAQFLPTWYHLGELLRSGYWPPVLDPGSWQGGNYSAEALFGIYNPLNALNWLLVSDQTNFNVAAAMVKAEFLTILALGVYLLCREYGASPAAACVAAIAMPFAGFTLYWEAASWASGLSAFMYAPHVWWSLRKVGRGHLNPLWAFLIGALAVTQGNPYGVLGAAVVGTGLAVEFALQGQWAGVRRVVLTGLCFGALIPLVFEPLLATAFLAHRSSLASITNHGMMRPNLGDLLNLSAPSYLPGIKTFVDPMRVPATYFTWLLIPLVPWLRWSTLRPLARRMAGVWTIVTIFVLLTLSPSTLWLFRWPLRLVEYFEMCLAVVLAVLLSAGLARDRVKQRWVATGVLIGLGAYLSLAQTPQDWRGHVAATSVVVVLVVCFVNASTRWRTGAFPAVIGVLGTLAVLTVQTATFTENKSAGNWDFPASIPHLQKILGGRYTGTTLQLADTRAIRKHAAKRGSRVWGGLTSGSVYHAAGVAAINTYTGVGLDKFTRHLCMDFKGNTLPCGYQRAFRPTSSRRPSLATLTKVQTVVMHRHLFHLFGVPHGWYVADRYRQVVVLHPFATGKYPGSRLSWVSRDVHVSSARTVSRTAEVVHLASTGGRAGKLIFARLGWPGYSASFHSQQLQVDRTSAGLLVVTLPKGAVHGTVRVSFTPPGQHVGLALGGVGTLGAAVLGVWPVIRRRRAAPSV